MRTRWAVSLAVATLMAMSSAGALAQIGSGAGEAGGLPEVANSAPMGSKDRPVRVSSGVMSSLILHRVDPIYPEDAKVDRISGAVVMGAIVDDHGKVTKLTVVAGPEGLRDALKAGKDSTVPLELLVENTEYYKTYKLDYHGGERYAHLVRDESKPDLLSEIYKAN